MRLNYRDFIRPVVLLIVAVSLLSPPVVRASEKSDARIRQGIAAFDKGEYKNALQHFSEAVRLGASKVSLYYDIGVTHYKLKQYKQADKAFLKVAQAPKWEALAQYNRALIAYREKQPEVARQLATLSIRLSQSAGLTSLNYRLLDKLEDRQQVSKAWSNLLHFGFGYNDNVLLTDAGASAISGKSDVFLDFTGRAKHTFKSRDPGKLQVIVQVNMRDYSRLNEYDQTGVRAGFEKGLGHADSAIGAYLEQVTLGGKSYELISSLEYKRKFTNAGKTPLSLVYSFNNYTMQDSAYAYLGGLRQRIRLIKKRSFQSSSLESYVLAEYNNRQDQTSGADFYSYSPLRLGVGTSYTKNLSPRQALTGSLFLQRSEHLDPDIRGGVAKTRQDDLLELKLHFLHVAPSKWIYRANYIHSVNGSNYSEFSYSQNIVSFEMIKVF